MTGAGAEARPVSEHSVTLDFGNGSDWPSRRLTCSAPADALCHASHDCSCEEWRGETVIDGRPVHLDYHRDDESGNEVEVEHVGTFKAECNLVDFFDGSDEVLRGEITLPVHPKWEGDYYTFELDGGAVTASLPDETVEAAARAEWAVQCEQSQAFTAALGVPAADVVPWEDVPEPIREKTRERVRAALQAAFPLIRSQVLTETADTWTQGAWGKTPRRTDRVADRMAAAQYVGDWLRALATAHTYSKGE